MEAQSGQTGTETKQEVDVFDCGGERFNYYILHFNPLHLLFVLIKHKNLRHQT